jgi:hypothetical protein
MTLRRLTEEGLAAAHRWLDSEAAATASVPPELLNDSQFSEGTRYPGSFQPPEFRSRLEWAHYITQLTAGADDRELAEDYALWSWMALAIFDQLFPGSRPRKLGQRARYIAAGRDFRTNYRHLLAGPWRLMSAHRDNPERIRVALLGPLYRPGEVYEQLASRLELATSPSVMEVAGRLYLAPGGTALKRGAGGDGGGSPRRLAQVLMQFDRTYDIYQMPAEQLLEKLPKEFRKFM